MPSIREKTPYGKIAVLDFGGQYAHLLCSRIRRLGVYAEIVDPEEIQVGEGEFQALIYSGGPSSVYEKNAPSCDPALSLSSLPKLGICYGHQLLMKHWGAEVSNSKNKEYGPAILEIEKDTSIFSSISEKKIKVWMSHGDEVLSLPPNFSVLAKSKDCPFAGVGNLEKKIFGVQFHPEVQETEKGELILKNFIKLSNLEETWKLNNFLKEAKEKIKREVGEKKVFCLLSGGVDSTVLFALLLKSLGPEKVYALHIDTGFMRKGESQEVQKAFRDWDVEINVLDASSKFFKALEGVYEPEKKRNIIGELFIQVQQEVTQSLGLNPEEWLLGQGTIYPDHIESGSSKHSNRIKTHHNRVSSIQELIEAGKVIEPLLMLYKDEVRELGELLGIDKKLLYRHPFPGPGLAIRCLCSEPNELEKIQAEKIKASQKESQDWQQVQIKASLENKIESTLLEKLEIETEILPIRSVGVQGDKRTYKRCLALYYSNQFPDWDILLDKAREIINQFEDFNRVLVHLGSSQKKEHILEKNVSLKRERIDLLRELDACLNNFLYEKKLYSEIWQCPLIILTIYSISQKGASFVLRPICSSDGMTASVYKMPIPLLEKLSQRLKSIANVASIFYDLSSKPPGTIEWE